MAKVSRSVLKEIVKECLVEILSEGLVSTADSIQENKRTKSSRRKRDRISPEVFQKRNKMLTERMEKQSSEINVDHLTDDPVMREIFADTAATTLREQPLSESSKKTDYVPADAAAKAVFENDLEDLFEGAGNWASLAFSEGKNN